MALPIGRTLRPMKRALALLFTAVFSCLGWAASAQTIPNVPDAQRYAAFNVTTATSNFDVPFSLYGDCTDLVVRINGVLQLQSAFTCVSKSGTPLASIARPITDAQVQLTSPASNSLVEILGAWHTRWGMGTAAGISRVEFNRTLGTILSGQREIYDTLRTNVPWAFAGVWNNTTTYALNSVVNYNGTGWLALQASTGQTPSPTSVYWSPITSLSVLGLNSAQIVASLGFTPVNRAGDTMTGNLDINPGTGWGNLQFHPTNYYGSFGDNAAQAQCNQVVGSSTVGATSPVFSCFRADVTIATGTTADAWPIMGTASVTSTTPVPGGGAFGSGQHVGVTGRFVRYNYAPGGAASNPAGWGGLSANIDLTGMPSATDNWGLIHEFDGSADGPDAGKIRGGAVVALTRRAVAVQTITATSTNGGNVLTSVGTNLTSGAAIAGYSGVSIVGWTVSGPGITGEPVVTAVTSNTITLSANVGAGAGTGTFNLRPTAEFSNAFSCSTGDANGATINAVNVGNCFTTNASVRESVYDARGATLGASANAIWLGDNKPIAWDTAGAFQSRWNSSTSRLETLSGGGVVAWLDGSGNLLVNGNISGTWTGTAIAANHGGTGQTAYTIGDLLYASGTAALSKLADVATGNVLHSGGVGASPAWGKVNLSTDLDANTLPTANSAALAGDVTKIAGTNNTVLATAQPSVHTWALAQTFTVAPVFSDQPGSRTALGLGTSATVNTGTSGATIPLLNGASTFSGATVFNSTAGGWSTSNFSKALVVTISAATANPAIGLFDSNNTNGTAFFSSSSGFQILAMPALSDSTTAAVNMITVSRTGLITGFNATLIASGTALTNGAGAQAGTLTNAPAAGNPTKWVPINDNGTTRYIPAW